MLLANRAIPVEVHGNGQFVIASRDFVPAYLKTYEEGRLKEKVDEALEALRSCTLCPRDCRVNRLENKFAVCKVGRYARVASFFHHFGEEDVLRGWRGSGTIFFSWCNLRCVFCLVPGTRVLTDAGPRRIEDLFAGADGEMTLEGGRIRFPKDLRVYTRHGRPAPATKVFCHPYRGEVVVIKPYGLPSLTVTPDHAVFAVSEPGGEVRKVEAGALTRSHFLMVPKLQAAESHLELDVRSVLEPCISHFRKSVRRKVPIATLRELAGAAASRRLTSTQIGERLGYHPAYVRTLFSRVRRGVIDSDEEYVRNDLIEERGRVRFKTEKGVGVPCRVPVDEALARLLGYYCAEGHVARHPARPNYRRLIFSFGLHEEHLVDSTRTLVRQIFGVDATPTRRRTTTTVEIGNTSLAALFERLCGPNSRTKHIPSVLLHAPASITQAFLESYFERDASRQMGYLAANSVSEDLALGIVALLLRLGIFPYFYATPRKGSQTIQGRKVRQSRILYYVKCRLEAWEGLQRSSRLKYRTTASGFLVPIRQISRRWYEGPVYNLEVADEDHSYTACGVAVGNCQNFETSQIGEGVEVSPGDLARMMLQLQDEGCHNINFVTPEHVVAQILEALLIAVEDGLRLPLVYNTSSYDSLHSIQLMDGVVDVYMPDFKLWDRERSRRYLLAPDYPDAARGVVRAMHEQVGELKVNEDGLAMRGVLVRHLVMPGMLDDTREIMRYLAGLSRDSFVNVMDQYGPAWRARREERFQDINRRVSRKEMDEAYACAREAGLWRFDTRWRQVRLGAWA